MLVESFEDAISRRTRKWPRLTDLQSGSVFIPREPLSEVLMGLEKNRYTVILGSEGRGKSTIAKVVGFKKLGEGEPVYIIECTAQGQTADQIGTFLSNRNRYNPLCIIDDIQADPEGMAALYEYVDSCHSSRFLFVWRKTVAKKEQKISGDDEWLNDLLTRAAIVRLGPDLKTVQGVISTYLKAHENEPRISQITSPRDVALEDCEWALDITGGNLRTLKSYLDIWDRRVGQLRLLNRGMILESIREYRLKPLLELGEETLQTYVDLAGVFQLDVAAWAGAFSPTTLDELERRGLIVKYGPAYYGLAHASDARDVVESFANLRGKESKTITDEAITRSLHYVDVPLTYAMGLMKSVGEANSYEPTESIRDHFADFAARHSLLWVKKEYVRSLCKTASDIRAFAKRLGRKPFPDYLITHTTMPNVREFLSIVRRIDPITANNLESTLTIQDKIDLYARSTLSFLARSLTYYAKSKKSLPFARKILAKVPSDDLPQRIARTSISGGGRFLKVASDIDQNLAIAFAAIFAENVSLQLADNAEELGLLINNLRVNELARLRLVQRVVEACEPERLLMNGSPDGYTFVISAIADYYSELTEKSKALRFFSFVMSYFDATRVSGLGDRSLAAAIWNLLRVDQTPEPWLTSIQSELSFRLRNAEPENVFWLLWSLFQANEASYRQLAGEAKNEIEARLNARSLGASELALLGLLSYTALPAQVSATMAPDGEIAETLLKHPHASKLLFALFGATQIGDAKYEGLRDALEARNETENLRSRINELVTRNNIESSQILLGELTKKLL